MCEWSASGDLGLWGGRGGCRNNEDGGLMPARGNGQKLNCESVFDRYTQIVVFSPPFFLFPFWGWGQTQTSRHAGASPKLLGKVAMPREREGEWERRGEEEKEAKGDLAGLSHSLLCLLAQLCTKEIKKYPGCSSAISLLENNNKK